MIASLRTFGVRGLAAIVAAVAVATADHAPAGHTEPVPASASECNASDATRPRTLADLLERVQHSARAGAAAADIGAATAEERQAAARRNPEIAVELEDFSGSGRYSSFGESQTTFSLSQRIELGGQRARRVDVAAGETGAEKARSKQDALRLAAAAKQELVTLLAARQRRAISVEGLRLAHEVLAAARRRVEGGAASLADVERASIAVATATLDVSEAGHDIEVSAQRLAGLWGGRATDAACLDGRLTPPQIAAPIPARPVVVTGNPAVAIAEAEVAVRRAEVRKARADAAPDLTVSAGVRHLAGPDEVSLVTGLNIEVPLFDRNGGSIHAAEQRLFAAQSRAQVARDDAASRIVRLREAAEAGRERAATLTTQAIPAAERAFRALSQAWRDGAASSLEVLDARRALIVLRLEQVDALAAFHRSLASLEASLGEVPSVLEDSAAGVRRTDR